jgi:hypothetical protein
MLTEKTATLIVRKKTNITHFESNDGEKKTKILVEVGNQGPGDAWEDCTCFLEVVNDELVIYPNDKHMQEYFEDFNFTKLIQDFINDKNLGQEVYDHELKKEFLPVSKEESTEEVEELKEIIIGEFKPKRKFLSFVSAVNGAKIRYIRDIAFVKGEKLSGMLEGAIFKITICDEGTIKFEEQEGTNFSDAAMIQRLIDEIDETDVTGYAQKFVVANLEFADIDGKRCYLEVENEKPIDKLRSIFEEEDKKMEEIKELSDKGLSVLDMLFGDSDDVETTDEVVEEEIVVAEEPVEETKSVALSFMEESFRKMNEDKVNELKSRIEDHQKEINKFKMDVKQAESKITENKEKLGILETRLDTMQPNEPSNGYVFFVSEEKKHDTGLDESTRHIADKIADIMKLKKDVLFNMLTEGYNVIKIAKKGSDYSKEYLDKNTSELTEEELDQIKKDFIELSTVKNSIKSIDIDGKFNLNDEGDITYSGTLNWHQLVAKMIKKGFEQDPDFDKAAGSNSYEKEEVIEETSDEVTDEDFKGLESSEEVTVDNGYQTQKLLTYDEPTDVILWSAPDTAHYSDADITITDDYAGLDIRVGGQQRNDIYFETAGFASATTFKEYEKFINKNGTDELGGTSALLIPNFQGTIRVGVKLEKGGFATDFDPNDDLMYLEGGGEPFLDFPEGTVIIEIDDDHDISKLKSFLRDKKIDSLGIK